MKIFQKLISLFLWVLLCALICLFMNRYFHKSRDTRFDLLTNDHLNIIITNISIGGRPRIERLNLPQSQVRQLTEEEAQQLLTSLLPIESIQPGFLSKDVTAFRISGYSNGQPVIFNVCLKDDCQIAFSYEWGVIYSDYHVYKGGNIEQFNKAINKIYCTCPVTAPAIP